MTDEEKTKAPESLLGGKNNALTFRDSNNNILSSLVTDRLLGNIYCGYEQKNYCTYFNENILPFYVQPRLRFLFDTLIIKQNLDKNSKVIVNTLNDIVGGNYDTDTKNIQINGNRTLTNPFSDYVFSYQDELQETFIHEITHSVIDSIFNNQCNPYFPGDKDAKNAFENALFETLNNIYDRLNAYHGIIENNITSYELNKKINNYSHLRYSNLVIDARLVVSSFLSISDNYKSELNHAEFIARYYSSINNIESIKALKILAPIIEYVNKYINPEIERYISQNRFSEVKSTNGRYTIDLPVYDFSLEEKLEKALINLEIGKAKELVSESLDIDDLVHLAYMTYDLDLINMILPKVKDDYIVKSNIVDMISDHAIEGNTEIISNLLANGIDINTEGYLYCSALYQVLSMHGYDIDTKYKAAKILVDFGADINKCGESTILSMLIHAPFDIDVIKLVLDLSADINFTDNYGQSALIQAANLYFHSTENNSVKSVENLDELIYCLIEHKADINIQDSYYGYTALTHAHTYKCGYRFLKILDECKSNIDLNYLPNQKTICQIKKQQDENNKTFEIDILGDFKYELCTDFDYEL